MAPATIPRASSTTSAAALPDAWLLEGLPKCSANSGVITLSTCPSTGVVALWSRYAIRVTLAGDYN